MVKRTVQFTVKADGGVTPAIPLFGGVKGEHHATVLRVTMDSDVYTDGDIVRLSFTTGDGTVLSSDLINGITAADGAAEFTYALPQLLTVAAGQLCVRVVLASVDTHGAETERWRSGEAVLYFEHADVENGTPFWTGVSEMLARTAAAKDAAVKAQTVTETAQSAVEAARDEVAASAAVVKDDRVEIEGVKDTIATQYKAVLAAKDEAKDAENGAQTAQRSAEEARLAAQDAQSGAQDASADAAQARDAAQAAASEALATVRSSMKYKGLLADWGELQAVTDRQVGDTYAVEVSGKDPFIVMWDATGWVYLSGISSDTVTDGSPDTVTGAAVYTFVKEQIGEDLLHYRGDVPSAESLPSIPNKRVGDVLFCTKENTFYMYDGETWGAFANATGRYTLTDADKQEIAALCASLLEDGNGVTY